MAKKSAKERNNKRKACVEKYKEKRFNLKKIIKSSNDLDVVMGALAQLAKLPRDSNPVRLNTICAQCGRPHAVYSKFQLCRICLRKYVMNGDATGAGKASW